MEIDRARAERRRDLFGGRGDVWVQSLAPGPLPEPFSALLLCELEAGGRVGAHRQAEEGELVVALAGEAVLRIDGVEHAVRPGRAVSLPLGAGLEIDNAAATTPFRYLIIKARATPET